MPRGKHLKLIFGVDGRCAIDAVNFTGSSCQAATKEITAALGGQIDHQQDKPQARARGRCGQPEREQAR